MILKKFNEGFLDKKYDDRYYDNLENDLEPIKKFNDFINESLKLKTTKGDEREPKDGDKVKGEGGKGTIKKVDGELFIFWNIEPEEQYDIFGDEIIIE